MKFSAAHHMQELIRLAFKDSTKEQQSEIMFATFYNFVGNYIKINYQIEAAPGIIDFLCSAIKDQLHIALKEKPEMFGAEKKIEIIQ